MSGRGLNSTAITGDELRKRSARGHQGAASNYPSLTGPYLRKREALLRGGKAMGGVIFSPLRVSSSQERSRAEKSLRGKNLVGYETRRWVEHKKRVPVEKKPPCWGERVSY